MRRSLTILIMISLAVWATTATGLALSARQERAALRTSYDDKVRAITARLVQVTSDQVQKSDELADCRIFLRSLQPSR